MNEMTEQITKSCQFANMLADSIVQLHWQAAKINRPEGRNIMDKALTKYLAEALEMARQLEAKLLAIAD